MSASILQVRYQIRDIKEPFSFPDEIIQVALDEAADFLMRKYHAQGDLALVSSNDPAILPVQTGSYLMGRGVPWVDYWLHENYALNLGTPIGAKVQKLMASVDLMSTLLMPTPDRMPTGVSEGGLSIQWGGDYQAAIDLWNKEIEKIMFSLEAPMFVMYGNY